MFDKNSQIKYFKPFAFLDSNQLSKAEQKTIIAAKEFITKQTDIWHLNSPKKVGAAVYVQSIDGVFVGQNIGISKVTGTLCAERAAITNAVSNYPELIFKDITILAIVGEYNPILPCGVCCEWLYKINPEMTLLTYNINIEKILRIVLKDYYADENLVLDRIVLNEN